MTLRRRWAGTPLRLRLVLLVFFLSAVALVATSLTAASLLQTQLLARVDDQLRATVAPVVDEILRDSEPGGPPGRPTEYSVTVLDAQGQELAYFEPTVPTEVTPPALVDLDEQAVGDLGGEPFTVEAEGGEDSWRVLAVTVPGGEAVVIGIPLTEVSSTLQQLLLIDALVVLVALVLLAALAWWAVTASLRPLTEVEQTASAIAAGDLSRRVPEHPASTEVGQLSLSLNTMLTQIENAVREQEVAAEQAQASEQRMRRFVADASHELRTPLTSIRGFAELYRQGAVSDPQALDASMGRIEDEATRMGLLVDDMLLLARLDQKRPLQQTPVDLRPLATDVVARGAALAPDHVLSLQLPPADMNAVVIGDEERLRQVLSNLVVNALSHTPAGTTVGVEVRADDTEVHLAVSDDGPGMSEADAARAFERFYRADSSRSRSSARGTGSGLGMSIVAGLVAAHGGRVDLDTTLGEGTTVRVTLPSAPQPPTSTS